MRKLGLVVTLAVAVAGCEPLDMGGGGGVGGRLAFLRSGALVVSQDDGSGERTLTEPDTAADPALAPNGQTVAFAFSPDGNENARGIYRVGFSAGAVIEPVAEPPAGTTYRSPVWSPNGQEIVFVSVTGSSSTVMRVPAFDDGAEPVAVNGAPMNARFPTFIDSARLLVSVGSNDAMLTIVDLELQETTDVGARTRHRPSVNADRIAYSKDAGGGVIWIRDLDSGEEYPIASTGNGDSKPAFSPDGVWVAFESSNVIYAARADASGDIEVLQSGTDVSWSP